MLERDDEIFGTKIHKTYRELAEYFVNGPGHGNGNSYKTHGDVWNADNEKRMVGLLELIYLKLSSQDGSESDIRMKNHQHYLRRHYKEDKALLARYHKQVARLNRLLRGICFIDPPRLFDINTLSWKFHISRLTERDNSPGRIANVSYWDLIDRIRSEVRKLKLVKGLKDIGNISGIGKVRKARVLAAWNGKG